MMNVTTPTACQWSCTATSASEPGSIALPFILAYSALALGAVVFLMTLE